MKKFHFKYRMEVHLDTDEGNSCNIKDVSASPHQHPPSTISRSALQLSTFENVLIKVNVYVSIKGGRSVPNESCKLLNVLGSGEGVDHSFVIWCVCCDTFGSLAHSHLRPGSR
jgi:hypothetical protein